ncbi:MAG TPA: DUF523 domain-containing protein [Candidatus Faecaligallichristensenella faecipullorum]|nr:DUF523 domain-containing protein [Candidatus Faecaligallichristensenella faecipullorum]
MKILISACLLGVKCRYDGKGQANPEILKLAERHELVPVCPEQLGGLPTPRPPAEIAGNRCLNKAGADVTEAFSRGAEQAVYLAQALGCQVAVLKSRSPSCGTGWVYDGSFSKKLIPGDGFCARALKEAGIRVFSDEEMDLLERE